MSVNERKPVNRIERRKQETRRRILDAGRTLLEREGFSGMSIKQVMELADLGYGTFYGHFETKEAMIWAVFRDMSDQLMAESVKKAANHPSPLREFLGWSQYFETIDHFRDLFGSMFGPGENAELRQYYQDYLVEVVLHNLETGVYQPAPMFQKLPKDYLARFVAGTQLQLTDWLLSPDCPYSAEEMATLLFRTIYHQSPPEVSTPI